MSAYHGCQQLFESSWHVSQYPIGLFGDAYSLLCVLVGLYIRDSEWQWHQRSHMQICTLTQTHNHASIPQLSFFYRPDALPAAQPTASKRSEVMHVQIVY